MTDITVDHEERLTISEDFISPGHAQRGNATPLFERTRKELLARKDGRCFICNCTSAETGHPLEAHHSPVEHELANMMDWTESGFLRKDFPDFDWANFDAQSPIDPMLFVDNMLFNGIALCKHHHTGKDQGIHFLTHSVWIAQRYAKEGYKFSAVETIHHDEESP
jgi:hypothetical protein